MFPNVRNEISGMAVYNTTAASVLIYTTAVSVLVILKCSK